MRGRLTFMEDTGLPSVICRIFDDRISVVFCLSIGAKITTKESNILKQSINCLNVLFHLNIDKMNKKVTNLRNNLDVLAKCESWKEFKQNQ